MKIMSKISLGLKWFLLLTKRLLKKPAFIVILLLIPILAAAMSRASEDANGILTVTIATDGERDELAEEIMKEFEKRDSLVLFKIFDSPEDAKTEVSRGRADAAWVIPGNLKEALVDYCRYSEEIVTVYEREETSFMALTREIIYGKLFPHISKLFSSEYTEEWLEDIEGYSKEDFLEFYERMRPGEDESFIEFEAMGGIGNVDTTETNHLKSPIRGFLAVLVVMCGLASCLTISADIERGTFAWLNEKRHIWVYHASGLGATLTASIVMVVSLCLAKMVDNILYEILTALLFAFGAAIFCSLVATVMRSSKRIAASIPPLIIILLALSPIFLRLVEHPLQHILPTYNYIYSSVEWSYTWIMCIYIPVGLIICNIISYVIIKFSKKTHIFTKK